MLGCMYSNVSCSLSLIFTDCCMILFSYFAELLRPNDWLLWVTTLKNRNSELLCLYSKWVPIFLLCFIEYYEKCAHSWTRCCIHKCAHAFISFHPFDDCIVCGLCFQWDGWNLSKRSKRILIGWGEMWLFWANCITRGVLILGLVLSCVRNEHA